MLFFKNLIKFLGNVLQRCQLIDHFCTCTACGSLAMIINIPIPIPTTTDSHYSNIVLFKLFDWCCRFIKLNEPNYFGSVPDFSHSSFWNSLRRVLSRFRKMRRTKTRTDAIGHVDISGLIYDSWLAALLTRLLRSAPQRAICFMSEVPPYASGETLFYYRVHIKIPEHFLTPKVLIKSSRL